jgi:hypothetical protein
MNRITINGVTIEGGRDIRVVGRSVLIDGQKIDIGSIEGSTLRVVVEGDLASLTCDGSAEVTGGVQGSVSAGGSVKCGDITGAVNAGGSVKGAAISGPVNAGGSVKLR